MENNNLIKFIRVAIATLIFFIAYPINAKEFFNKSLWIVRDHITSKRSIDEVIQFAEANKYNVLFVQVRGRGDAYYSSKLVPRTHLLKKDGFDPLQYILKKVKNNFLHSHNILNHHKYHLDN